MAEQRMLLVTLFTDDTDGALRAIEASLGKFKGEVSHLVGWAAPDSADPAAMGDLIAVLGWSKVVP